MNSTLDFLLPHFIIDNMSERERLNAVVSGHFFLIVARPVYLTRRNLNYFCVVLWGVAVSKLFNDFGLATPYSI